MSEILFESSFKILMYGLFLAVPFYVMAFHFREKFLWAVCGAITLLIIIALVIEWYVVTPKEEVEQSIRTLAKIVENNDVDGVVDFISKSKPDVVSKAQHEMPGYDFNVCNIFRVHDIKVDPNNPRRATADFMVRVNLSMRGYTGSALRDVLLTFEKESDGQWRIVDYTHFDPANRPGKQNFFY